MGRARVSGRDIAVDLGTANTLVYVRGHGVVISEPSVVAIDEQTGTVRAVGQQAKQMIGRAPAQLTVVRPLANGVIADFEVAAEMLRYFLRQVGGRYSRARVVLCVPSGVTEVEKRAVEEAALEAGAREAYLIEEPVAAAIGAGLPVAEARGNMIVDIGGGTTEVAVVSLGGIVVSQSLRVAGDDMDDAIMRAIRRDYHVVIGQPTAEQLKLDSKRRDVLAHRPLQDHASRKHAHVAVHRSVDKRFLGKCNYIAGDVPGDGEVARERDHISIDRAFDPHGSACGHQVIVNRFAHGNGDGLPAPHFRRHGLLRQRHCE